MMSRNEGDHDQAIGVALVAEPAGVEALANGRTAGDPLSLPGAVHSMIAG
jgi:hypothetical protein